jgi:hypothetical protein
MLWHETWQMSYAAGTIPAERSMTSARTTRAAPLEYGKMDFAERTIRTDAPHPFPADPHGWRSRGGLHFHEVEAVLDWLETAGVAEREVHVGLTPRRSPLSSPAFSSRIPNPLSSDPMPVMMIPYPAMTPPVPPPTTF